MFSVHYLIFEDEDFSDLSSVSSLEELFLQKPSFDAIEVLLSLFSYDLLKFARQCRIAVLDSFLKTLRPFNNLNTINR